MQKAGTTFTGTIGCSRNGQDATHPIICGVYDPATGNRITGVRGAAKVNGNNASIGINMQDRFNVLVEGFEVYNCLNYGVYEGHSAGTADEKADYITSIQLKNLYIHDIHEPSLAAIWIQGTGVKYNDILIEDCAGDGISHAGQCIGEDITIRRINNTVGGLGDCIQQQTVRAGSIWRRCRLDHTNNNEKQCLVMGTGVLIAATGTIVEDCEFIGDASGAGMVSISAVSGVTIRRNRFYGDKGVYVLDATSVVDVCSNIFIGKGGNTIGVGSALNATVNCTNNTILNHQRGIELLGINNVAKNNIVYCEGAGTPITAISKVTNFTTNPCLNSSYRPSASGCMGTGTAFSASDYYGATFAGTPNIGAVDTEACRPRRHSGRRR